MSYSDKNIVWIDMEMTGLDPDKDTILEVACLVTDKDLKIISEEFNVVINQPLETLKNMNEWCLNHHSKTGLIKESLASKVIISDIEEMLLRFLEPYVLKGQCLLAGNTVYMDKFFLMKYMPRVVDHLHYRILDVSSVYELVRRWYPCEKPFEKSRLHRALPDIRESIEELKYYRNKFFKESVTL